MRRRLRRRTPIRPEFLAREPLLDRAHKRATVLVVDDSLDVRELLQESFSQEKNVLTAKDCDSAIEVMRDVHVDLVVSDLRMVGRHGGLRLLDWVKKNRPDAGFILMSGDLEESERSEAIRLGADRILKKPWAPEEFRRTVSDVLEHTPQCGR